LPSFYLSVIDTQVISMTTTSPEFPTELTLDPGLALELDTQTDREHSFQQSQDRIGKRSIWSSIRLKATLLAVAIGVIPVVAIGATAYYFADRSIKEKISLEQKQKTEELADKLNLFMFERFGDIQVLSNLPSLIDSRVRAVLPPEEKKATLDRYAEIYGVYDSIVVADLNGNVLIQAGREKAPANIAFREYFKQARAGRVFISEPEISKVTGKPSIFVAAPLRDRDTSEIIGIMRTRMPSDQLERLAKIYISGKQEYLFASASGKVFSARSAEDINQEATVLFPTIIPFVAQEQPGTVFTSHKGETLLVGFAPVVKFENMPPLGWSVLTIADSDITFKAQRELLLILASGTMIAAALVGAIAALVANRGTRPILQASSAVEKLGQGDLDTRIPVTGSDELAVLGSNINQMAGQIQTLLETQKQNAVKLTLQNDTLRELARNDGLLIGDVSVAAKAFTEATAKTLDIARVSVWFYNQDRNVLSSFDLFDRQSQEHSKGVDLKATDFPGYFQALEREPSIVADDAHTYPATKEFSEVYLKPLGITSMLDVPIQSAGRTIGVICCEHVGTARQWKAEEQSFVTSIANLISLAKESELLQGEVGDLLDVVSAVEDGDLTTRALVSDRTTGLVADTFNRLLEQLGEVLGQVQTTSQQVSAGAINLEDLAQTVAINADRQAQEVAEVLSLTQRVEQSSQNAGEQVDLTNRALQEARSEVEQGQTSIAELNDGIEVLRQGTDRIVQGMKTLGEFVGLAEQFVQDQGQIASLTQVLALNATLVAARASEQKDPRKFAVVAREFEAIAGQVGNLAQQTNTGLESLQQRTSQINEVVSNIDTVVQGLGGLVNGFTKGVEESNQVFRNIETTTGEVVKAGELVTQSNQEVLKAAKITAKAMQDIADIANTTALLTQSTRSQTEQMENLSQQLLQRIQFFQLPAEMTKDDTVARQADIAQSPSESSKIPSFAEVAASL
jgi:methyl-accepting chemotaxis protein PixJ